MKSPAKLRAIELLFEIGCEEIPAGMLPKAEEDLRLNLEKLLAAENLSADTTVETFSAPRRLTAWVRGLPVKQADVELEVTGPPKSVAYDAVGAPTRAALSFADKQRVEVSSLYLVQTAKGEYLATKQVKVGRTTEQMLTAVLPRAVHDLTWPRSMTWTGLEGPRFIRPIRWVVAVLDGKPLRLEVAGVAAGNATRGHRFLGSSAIRVRHSSITKRRTENSRRNSWPSSTPARIRRASSVKDTSASSGRALPTPGSFGRPTRNVGSPTISRSSSALRTNPAWAATGTKWSASGISRAGLPSSGSTSGCTRRMSRKPTVPPSWRSAISRPKWFANSRNSRASSAAFTRVRRASLTRSPMPSMTITARLAWTIQSREI